MGIAVVAEKPSVARDIAAVLGAHARRDGFFEGAGYRVTWAIGHLVGLAEPHQIRPEWKAWRWHLLPMLPSSWPLVVLEKTRAQFEAVRRVLADPEVREIVCATDAGREGELIFRQLYDAAGCRKPVKRLWISSLTEDAIRDGFRRLKDARAYDPLADAAMGRSRADWLVGMNLSRAYGLKLDQPLSVGRVQTPALAMLVERELAIRAFVPEDYLEVVATFSPREGERYDGTYFKEVKGERVQRLPKDGAEATAVVARAKAPDARAQVRSKESETKRMPPPLLYDLTELQRHANRLYGFSAQKTLELAQALYEQHKVLSYPRTSSRHLSTEVAATVPSIVRAVRGPYEAELAPGTGERPLSRRFVDDAKVTDHHALIPTAVPAAGKRLSGDEQRIYDLVCRRFLQAWHGDFVWDATRVVTEIASRDGTIDLFASSGSAIREKGWKVLDVGPLRAPSADPGSRKEPGEERATPEQLLPEGLAQGLAVKVVDAKAVPKKTQPPRRFTDATLLTAMETAGKTLDEKELSDAMKECGLGTPATRAAIIETLLTREYIVRRGKTLEATEKGIGLIAAVDPAVKSPEMTGQWEARLQRIERGEGELEPFLRGIEQYVRDVIGRMPAPPPKAPKGDPRQGSLFGGPANAGGAAAGGAYPAAASARAADVGGPAAASPGTAARSSRVTAPEGNAGVAIAHSTGAARSGSAPPLAQAASAGAISQSRTSAPLEKARPSETSGRVDARGLAGPTIATRNVANGASHDAAPTIMASTDATRSGSVPGASTPLSTGARTAAVARERGDGDSRQRTREFPEFAPGRDANPHRGDSAKVETVSGTRPAIPDARSGGVASHGVVSQTSRDAAAGARSGSSATTTVAVSSDALHTLLRERFHFPAFRPHQEAVCRAAANGEDALLVMPTGAGKSLCYQLPGLARGGVTLVVSPLIALMEDQVAQLKARGLRAERVHSGRDRSESSAAMKAYREGALDYLFIAPERLGLGGFVEQLAARTPSLIAIDEAHCISQWGHDFRPDYRLLGQRLPQLRPAPVIALTATATPEVQRDIVQQLGLKRAKTFIHGFRRTNLGIEVVELTPQARPERAKELLADPARRPAIVYAPSRKVAEAVAEELGDDYRCAAYHAGLSAKIRDEVQAKFQRGELEVIVATIAFGMGVDKADVRTVLHLALPGTVEGYYQEIGRAGRDGKPSRAILLHSYADRRTHEFFHERDYPDASELERIYRVLDGDPQPREAVQARLRMDIETFEKALEKLWVHGGAVIDAEDRVTRGTAGWKTPYLAQRARRTEQLAQMGRFAESATCRMLQVIRHFGDDEDPGTPCGQCDVCSPASCVAASFRAPDASERALLSAIFAALTESDGQSTGRMCRQLLGETPEHRRKFDALIGGLVRGGLVRLQPDVFEKDGKQIQFTRAWRAAGATAAGLGAVRLVAEARDASDGGGSRSRRKSKRGTKARGGARRRMEAAPASGPLVDALKAWRLQEARRRKIPAFRILTDKTLFELARAKPANEDELLRVNGIGPKIAQTYGARLMALCRGA